MTPCLPETPSTDADARRAKVLALLAQRQSIFFTNEKLRTWIKSSSSTPEADLDGVSVFAGPVSPSP